MLNRFKAALRRFTTESSDQAVSASRRFGRATKGMAAIEMALIFPIMTITYFGMIDVTNLLAAKRRVTLSSSTIADLVAQAPGTITTADLNGFYAAITPIMDPFPTTTTGVQVYTYRINGAAVTLRWQHSTGQSCGAPPVTAGYSDLMLEGNDLVVAKTCITLMPITGKVIANTSYTLRKETALRPREEPNIVCTNC
jgi:Flp pilus assembly protein TadG